MREMVYESVLYEPQRLYKNQVTKKIWSLIAFITIRMLTVRVRTHQDTKLLILQLDYENVKFI